MPTKSENKLKPCPKCGDHGVWTTYREDWERWNVHLITCSSCDCRTSNQSDPESARNSWNEMDRPPKTLCGDDVVEALENFIDTESREFEKIVAATTESPILEDEVGELGRRLGAQAAEKTMEIEDKAIKDIAKKPEDTLPCLRCGAKVRIARGDESLKAKYQVVCTSCSYCGHAAETERSAWDLWKEIDGPPADNPAAEQLTEACANRLAAKMEEPSQNITLTVVDLPEDGAGNIDGRRKAIRQLNIFSSTLCPLCRASGSEFDLDDTSRPYMVKCSDCGAPKGVVERPRRYTDKAKEPDYNTNPEPPKDEPREPLLPCPFCGGEPMSYRMNSGSHRVKCMDCQTEGPIDPNPIEAQRLWNELEPRTFKALQLPVQELVLLVSDSQITENDIRNAMALLVSRVCRVGASGIGDTEVQTTIYWARRLRKLREDYVDCDKTGQPSTHEEKS